MRHHPAIVRGKVAVVTGAASGIGRAAAAKLGHAGMGVVLADVDEVGLAEAAEDLTRDGVAVRTIGADVSDPASLAYLREAAHQLGPVSLLMNNAGREGGGGILAGADIWQQTIATNLMGPLYGIQAFLPDLLAADWPCAIVNTGSKQGITLPPGDTAYNVSKAALKALTESLAHHLRAAGDRITAHLLIPGFTFTGLTRARGVTEKPPGAWTAEQVVDFMLAAMARGDFYILCPDNEVTRPLDEKRIAWSAGDIIENRSALSRWDPRYEDAFRAFMEGKSE
ncbi:SDR family NAD(P)-dependent oxidoreductase [Allosphingosinicella deserti]|uniref:Short-chain dehydrogenase n=1 Tax=Allosphingosinicella deserti TaxID=2116704 RepID=A0A2P7QR23_9SPHN|nr:SDR family NAD(P)-dependent oxidoreductase [Sphingomonas deserti]PSJ40412.1 short-chain dehydrogenase [Sphingomonas deserti]